MAATADLGKLKVNDFSKYVDKPFKMQTPDGKAVTLTLKEAVSHGNELPKVLKTKDGKQELKARDGGGFTLQFVAPAAARLNQGTYPIEHPERGTLEMFLTPTGFVHGGRGYHAVFG
jgi:hypothetical protein